MVQVKVVEKVVTLEEQVKRGGSRYIVPRRNWPYRGAYDPKIHGTYNPNVVYGAQPSKIHRDLPRPPVFGTS